MIRSRHYTPAHEDFRAGVRRFMEKECAPYRDAWQAAGRTPPELWRKAGEAGLLCTKMSPEYGGGGGDLFHCLIVLEEQTRICFNELTFYLHSDIIAPYIELYGTEDQKRRYLPKMATGEFVAAIAMTEPGAGSDLQAIRTTARAVGNGYRLNGQKVFISNGQVGNLIVVAAKTDGGAGAKGISLFLLETEKAEGFTRGKNLKKIGCKAQDSSELFFDDVYLPPEALLGGVEGQGFPMLMRRLPEERLIMAMSAVANTEEAVTETVAYTSERKAFGQRLMDFQNTRFKLAEAKTKAVLGRVFLERCMDAFIEGKLDTTTAAMLKWWTTQRQNEVADECLQLHGGYGYMMEYDIARRYADSRLGRIAGGTNEIMKDIIGRTL
ncbi:MAG: acyl-CoA dehydrogenase family protein [Proteobacteria bacterium]|nr:acyl-CoA dehydrogenase family protein [Pseudomonadota bacterium]